MLLEMKTRGIRPDLILFADTGAEKPETCEHLEKMNRWCKDAQLPEITLVQYKPRRVAYRTLEEECLTNETLHSLAFGMKSCSIKWKRKRSAACSAAKRSESRLLRRNITVLTEKAINYRFDPGGRHGADS